MKKGVTALVCAAAIILGGFIAAPDVRAEEILFISTGYFKGSSEITAKSVCSGTTVTITGTISDMPYTDVTLSAFSDKENMTIDNLSAMEQTVSDDGGRFEFSFDSNKKTENGAINIAVWNSVKGEIKSVSAEYSVTDKTGLLTSIKRMRADIDSLTEKCKTAGIPLDYTYIKTAVIDKFTDLLDEEVNNSDVSRVEYYNTVLGDLYAKARQELVDALSGNITNPIPPRYKSSAVKADNGTLLANTSVQNGNHYAASVTERPIFLTGFGHWDYAMNDVASFDDMGFNFLHAEIGPKSVLKHPDPVADWNYCTNGFLKSGTKSEISENGRSGRAMSIKSTTAYNGESYVGISQTIKVKPNTTYVIGFYIKGSQIASSSYYSFGKSERFRFEKSYDDYTRVTQTYKTAADETEAEFKIIAEDINSEILIDDVYVKVRYTDDNLVNNSGFENDADNPRLTNGFKVDYTEINNLKKCLETAEENNVAVTLLVSPHYFPGFLTESDETINSGNTVKTQYLPFNPTHPKVRDTLVTYLDILIPQIKEYVSLESIIIANEPAFLAGFNGTENGNAYYIPKWQEFLKERYGTITSLNNKYGSGYSGFSEVLMPSWGNIENPANGKDKKCIDYIEFNNAIIYDFHKYMSEEIKRLAPNIKIHTKMMAYLPKTAEVTNNQYLANGNEYSAVSELMNINGCDGAVGYREGAKDGNGDKHGFEENLIWYDFMRSVKNAPIYNTEDHSLGDGLNDDGSLNHSTENTNWLVASLWQGAIHGKNGTALWQWNHDTEYINGEYRGTAFTLRPYDTYMLGKTSLDLNRLSYEITAIQTKAARVALFYSDYSSQWNNCYRNALYQAYCEAIYNGQKVNFVTDYNPEKMNENDYDVVIAVMPNNVTEKSLNEMRKYVNGGGELVLTKNSDAQPLGANKYNEAFDESDYSDIIRKSTTAEYKSYDNYYVYDSDQSVKGAIKNAISKNVSDYNKIRITDVSTGEEVCYTEVNSAEYNGADIINILNMEKDKTKTVRVSINGESLKSSVNLISGETLGETFELKPYVPVFITTKKSKANADIILNAVKFDGDFNRDGKGSETVDYNISDKVTSDTVMALFTVPDDIKQDDEVVLFICEYDGDRLIKTEQTERTNLSGGEVIKLAIELNKNDENTKIKAFLWNKEMSPMCAVRTAENRR